MDQTQPSFGPLPSHIKQVLDLACDSGAIGDYEYRPPKVYVTLSESVFPLLPDNAATFARKLMDYRESVAKYGG